MNKLLDRKVYVEVRNIPKEYANSCGYINVFDLHKKLTHIIIVSYTKEEQQDLHWRRKKIYEWS